MLDGTAVMERPINSPVELTDIPGLTPAPLERPDTEKSTFTGEEGAAPVPDVSELINGPERTIDDLRETLAQMKKGAGRTEIPKEDVMGYKPEKPVGKIRRFLKRHPVLAPIMAPLAGLAALMMLIARSASKLTKERQGQ